MELVFRVERVLHAELVLGETNLTSFGDFVSRLHWHVIPHCRWDTHLLEAVRGPGQRASDNERMVEITTKLPVLSYALQTALAGAWTRSAIAPKNPDNISPRPIWNPHGVYDV